MKIWNWIKAKLGRLTTACGGLVALADLDLSPVKDQLESIFTHKGVQVLTLVLFVVSYLRHQHVASLHPANPESPAPVTSGDAKA